MSTSAPARAKSPEERSWWRLGSGGWRQVLRSTAQQFKQDDIPILAASVTLRLVLALVPSLIAAVAISTFFISAGQIEELVQQADDFIPPQSRDFVITTLQGIVEQEAGGVAAITGILAGLWAATGGAAALIKALNAAYDVTDERGFVGLRLTALAIVVALFLSLAAMFVILVFGPTLVDLLLPAAIAESALRPLITLGRYAAAVAVLMLFFGFTFRIGPNRAEPKWRLLTPGAVLGVAGWLLLSFLFSVYVRTAGNYSAYGAAAGVFILLIWLNYSMTVLLMGAELDNEIEKLVTRRATPSPAVHPTAPADLDAVDEGMPRHPGLVGAGVGAPSRTAARTAAADAPAGRPTTADRPAPLPRPRLAGAAARSSGAPLAGRIWGRRSP